MDTVTWQNPHSSGANVGLSNLFSYVAAVRMSKGLKGETSYQHTFTVNEDGLECRDLGSEAQRDFKRSVMHYWHCLVPALVKPFTGTIEVNVHNMEIELVKFHRRQTP